LVSSRFCHRFVGYLEEEAVVTYSHAIELIDKGELLEWNNLQAPLIAKNYWLLRDNATIRDVLMVIRADEAHHRLVNHKFGSMNPDEDNPFPPGT